jgi:hypothetical protein
MLKAALPRPRHLGIRTAFTSYYSPLNLLASTAASAVVANRPYYVPFYLGPAVVDRISINVTAGSAGNCRLALYTNVNGMPGSLIVDAGAANTTSIALVELSFTAVTLPDDFFWAMAHFDATPTVTTGTAAGSDQLGIGAATATSRGLHTASQTYAAAPATAYAPDAYSLIGPFIMLRKS